MPIWEKLVEGKETFKQHLSEKASELMKDHLKALGHKRGNDFWMSYRKLFSESSPKVGLIKNKQGELLFSKNDIAKEVQELSSEENI